MDSQTTIEIRAARQRLGLKQVEVAALAGVSLATIKRAEHAQKTVSTDSLILIARALDLPVGDVVLV